MFGPQSILLNQRNVNASVVLTYEEDGEQKYLGMDFRPYSVSLEVVEEDPLFMWDDSILVRSVSPGIERVTLNFERPLRDLDGKLITYRTQPPQAPRASIPHGRLVDGVPFTDQQWETAKRVLLGKKARR